MQETSDTDVEAIEPDPHCSWQGYSGGGCGVEDESAESRSALGIKRIRIGIIATFCKAFKSCAHRIMKASSAAFRFNFKIRLESF